MVESASTGWVCPKCGRRFAKVNQQHKCEVWTLDDLLGDKPPLIHDLFHKFVALVKACGDFEYSITKANIGFRGSKRIFAGALPKPQSLNGYLDLPYTVDDPRFGNVSPYTKRLFVHHFRLTSLDQLDDKFGHWIFDSYRVGQGDHLKNQQE